MITYQVESIKSCLEDLEKLFISHYDEVEKETVDIDFDPDLELLILAEESELLKLFTVRSDKELIGYYLTAITPSLNNRGVLISTESGFYIKKEYRGSDLGLSLLKYVEETLLEEGVRYMLASTKVNQPCDSLFKKAGMTLNERQYIKHIGK